MKQDRRMEMVLDLINKGFTSSEIIEELKISDRTLRRYGQKNEEIRTKLAENNKSLNKLINTAYKVALGYKIKKQKLVKTDNGGSEVVEFMEEVPPSSDMIKYLLNNRDKKNYSNNPNKDRIDNELLQLKKKLAENNIIE